MIRGRVTMSTEIAASVGVGLGRGGRMSRQRKRDAVLRLVRGEDLETLSRALGVTAATVIGWQDSFLAAGEASLATTLVGQRVFGITWISPLCTARFLA